MDDISSMVVLESLVIDHKLISCSFILNFYSSVWESIHHSVRPRASRLKFSRKSLSLEL